MTPATWIQLALALLRFANWVTAQISQKQWEASGYAKAIAEQQAAIDHNVGIAYQIYKETAAKTTEELNRELQE